MAIRKRLPTSAEEWISHALSDLNLARIGQGNDDVLREQVCFHVQQAVEKALKAVLLFRKVEFPEIHDLNNLVAILEKVGIRLPADIPELGYLTPHAEILSPVYSVEITEDDADEAIRLAKKVLTWASEYISKR